MKFGVVARVIANAFSSSMMLQSCGFGLWLAWSYLMFFAGVWVDSSELNSSAMSNVFMASTIGYALTCAGFALNPACAAALLCGRKLLMGFGVASSIACVFIYLCGPRFLLLSHPEFATVLSLGSAVVTGFGTALIAARCMQMLSLLAPRRAWYVAASNILLSCGVYYVAVGSSSEIMIVMVCLLPACASLLLSWSPAIEFERDVESASPCAVSVSLTSARFNRFCIMAFVLTMSLSVVRSESSYLLDPVATLGYTGAAMLLRIVLSLILLVGILSISKSSVLSRIYQSVLLVVVFVPLAFAVFSISAEFTNALLTGSYTIFEILMFCILAHLSASSEVDAAVAFGRGWGAVTLGGLLGWLAGSLVINLSAINDIELIMALLTAVVCVLMFMFVFTGRDLDDLVRECVSDDELALPVESADKLSISFEDALESFSGSAGLSKREIDIVRLFLLGSHPKEIAEELFLSINTVRRHISNVYAKTAVHSRDELFEAFYEATGFEGRVQRKSAVFASNRSLPR